MINKKLPWKNVKFTSGWPYDVQRIKVRIHLDINDITDITDITVITDITDIIVITDITDITVITDITDITVITDITDITDYCFIKLHDLALYVELWWQGHVTF